MARFRRRRYDADDEYDPYDPRNRRWGPPRRYYRSAPGGSCLRDACLLETGCCIAEGLDGNCLVLTLAAVPQLAAVLQHGARGRAGADRVAGRVVGAIRVYQREISAHRPPVCRYTPSCSEYAAQAVARHGAARGGLLAAARLVRCRPGGRRGPDPVPAPVSRRRWWPPAPAA